VRKYSEREKMIIILIIQPYKNEKFLEQGFLPAEQAPGRPKTHVCSFLHVPRVLHKQ